MSKNKQVPKQARGTPPDVRATKELQSYIEDLVRIAKEQVRAAPGEGTLDAVAADEEQEARGSGGISWGTTRRLWEDDFEYEGRQEIEDDLLDILRARDDALADLEDGNFDDLANSINAILDHIGNRDLSYADIENWVDVLKSTADRGQGAPDAIPELPEIVSARVRRLSIELIHLISQYPGTLAHIEWRQLEHVIATALEGIGFYVTLTPSSKDGGKDVIATCTLSSGASATYFVEIKHWRSGKRVSSKPVSDFVQVNVKDATAGGLFISTSGFDGSVYTCFTEMRKANVQLGGTQKVVSLCSQYIRFANGLWQRTKDLTSILMQEATLSAHETGVLRS